MMSMATLKLVPVKDDHVLELAQTMRPLDRREVMAFGLDPLEAVGISVDHSYWCRTAVDGQGRVAALCGLGILSLGVGEPWMLSAHRLSHHKKDMLRLSRAVVDDMRRHVSRLSGLVDGRYEAAVRWVSWLGFDLTGTPSPFLRFEWRA